MDSYIMLYRYLGYMRNFISMVYSWLLHKEWSRLKAETALSFSGQSHSNNQTEIILIVTLLDQDSGIYLTSYCILK